jgi:RimJ/RimL family protein N-acetyltransferase
VGMQQEAILRDQQILDGRYQNHILYGILADEWEKEHVS